jgi:hypothetical protein
LEKWQNSVNEEKEDKNIVKVETSHLLLSTLLVKVLLISTLVIKYALK